MKVSTETFFFLFFSFISFFSFSFPFPRFFGIITKISLSYLASFFMSRKTQLSLFAVALLILSLGSFWYLNRSSLEPAPAQPAAPAANLEQANSNTPVSQETEPAKEVALARTKEKVPLSENAEFTISGGSPTSSIRFYEGSITPLDVHVGNTQDFRIVVSSDNGIKRVVAEIETDFGYDYVELKKDRVISVLDTMPNPYTVNPKDNTLKILNDTELAQARNDEYQKELARKKSNQANASLGQREVWIGSWLVNKVHDKVYHTNFIAYDSAGNQEKITMAWSDLCAIPLSGSWDIGIDYRYDCSIPTNTVDGVANGTTTISSGLNLTLAAGSTFLWNNERSISFETNGRLTVNTGGQLKQVPTIYVKDQDNDRYIAPGNLGTTQTSTVGLDGWHPRANMLGETDCNDNNRNVMPDSAIYGKNTFTNIINPALSYDYDCNGVHEVNPLDAKYCPSPDYISGSTDYVYTKYSCAGYDTGGCCGGGGSGGCSGPDCTISKLRDLWSIRTAKAKALACCNTSSVQLKSIYGCNTISSTPTSFCGQSKSVAVESFYSSLSSCGAPRTKYYRVKTTNIGCR